MAVNDFFRTKAGLAAGIIFVLLAIVAAFFAIHSAISPSYATKIGADRVYICSETGKTFNVEIAAGQPSYPVKSPYTGKDTGYPTEVCYWTASGAIADKPTYVLLNDYIGKPGPTFCPVCGRLVVGHNPAPIAGSKPPPTKQEYLSRHGEQ